MFYIAYIFLAGFLPFRMLAVIFCINVFIFVKCVCNKNYFSYSFVFKKIHSSFLHLLSSFSVIGIDPAFKKYPFYFKMILDL